MLWSDAVRRHSKKYDPDDNDGEKIPTSLTLQQEAWKVNKKKRYSDRKDSSIRSDSKAVSNDRAYPKPRSNWKETEPKKHNVVSDRRPTNALLGNSPRPRQVRYGKDNDIAQFRGQGKALQPRGNSKVGDGNHIYYPPQLSQRKYEVSKAPKKERQSGGVFQKLLPITEPGLRSAPPNTLSYSSMLKRNTVSEPIIPFAVKSSVIGSDSLDTERLVQIDVKRQQLKEKKKLKKKRKKEEARQQRETLGDASVASVRPKEESITLDISGLLDSYLRQNKQKQGVTSSRHTRKQYVSAGPLPRTATSSKTLPVRQQVDKVSPLKRGKIREKPRKKRLTMLRQVILASRKRKKEMAEIMNPPPGAVPYPQEEKPVEPRNDVSVEGSSVDVLSNDAHSFLPEKGKEEPIKQEPCQVSSGINTDVVITENKESVLEAAPVDEKQRVTGPSESTPTESVPKVEKVELTSCDCLTQLPENVCRRLHSRKFREYCDHLLGSEIDETTTTLLSELMRFQDRVYHENPSKYQQKKRLIQGLREVRRALKVPNKLKCVILAPNLERVPVQGGIDDYIGQIVSICRSSSLPMVFAMSRQRLGKILRKKVPVSVIGVISHDGATDHFKRLVQLTDEARLKYAERLREICLEEGVTPPGDVRDDQSDESNHHGDTDEQKQRAEQETTDGAAAAIKALLLEKLN